jgi:hypothetical protein
LGLGSLLFFAINGSRKYAFFRPRENVRERIYTTANILPEQKDSLSVKLKNIFSFQHDLLFRMSIVVWGKPGNDDLMIWQAATNFLLK